MLTMSVPERRLSLGTCHAIDFEDSKYGGIICQAEVGEVFTLKLQGDRFAKVCRQCIQSFGLCNHRQIQAFCNVKLLALEDADLDDLLFHASSLSHEWGI